MRRIGATIESVRNRHDSRQVRGDINRPGAELVKNAQSIERLELRTVVGGSVEIASVPATFTYVEGGVVTQVCSFAIPAGTYESGYWRVVGTVTNPFLMGTGDTVTTNAQLASFPVHGVGAYDESTAVSAAQLTHINANAGGSISATHSISGTEFNPGGSQAITLFKLYLVPTGGGTVRELWIAGVHPMSGHYDTTVRWIG